MTSPVYPPPEPYTPNFLRRLRRGLSSWFGLLNEWDFRIPVGALRFLGLHLLLVNEPAAVRQVMVTQVEQFPKHPYTLWILEPLIGRAIFSVNGEEWAQQRRLVDQAFQVAQLQRVFPQMAAACAASLERLAGQADGRPVDADAEMTLLTADVIVRTILSRPLAPAEAGAIFAAFSRYQKRAGRALLLRFLRLPRGWLQRYLATHAAPIRRWIAAAIDERLASQTQTQTQPLFQTLDPDQSGIASAASSIASPASGTANDAFCSPSSGNVPADGPSDLLAALLAARDPDTGQGFSRGELVDQVCFLFLAGHETSASALGMATYLLSCFPEAQERLRAEVQACLAGDDRPLAYDDLRRMPYGLAVLQETLRLYPPVSFFIREARSSTNLAGSRCPMRALVTVSPWVIQRHEQHWSDPHGFRPERFLAATATAEERGWARDAFLPFGLGPRKCPGAAFALQEALLMLAGLVHRFQLLPDPSRPPDLVARLTLRARNGIHVRLKPLQP